MNNVNRTHKHVGYRLIVIVLRFAALRRGSLQFSDSCYLRLTWTKKMHCFLLIYFIIKPLHVSNRLAAYYQEDQLCINSAWLYQLMFIQSASVSGVIGRSLTEGGRRRQLTLVWLKWEAHRLPDEIIFVEGFCCYFRITWTKKIHCFLLICFNSKPLHVSSRLTAYYQEDQLCINSAWLYQLMFIQS
jgi:hypothetical protein